MSNSNNSPILFKHQWLPTVVVSVACTVLALVAFGVGVATIIVIEVNGWPAVSLLASAGMWVVGAYYLVLAHDLREIHDVETSPVRGHLKTETDDHDDAEFLAA